MNLDLRHINKSSWKGLNNLYEVKGFLKTKATTNTIFMPLSLQDYKRREKIDYTRRTFQ